MPRPQALSLWVQIHSPPNTHIVISLAALLKAKKVPLAPFISGYSKSFHFNVPFYLVNFYLSFNLSKSSWLPCLPSLILKGRHWVRETGQERMKYQTGGGGGSLGREDLGRKHLRKNGPKVWCGRCMLKRGSRRVGARPHPPRLACHPRQEP